MWLLHGPWDGSCWLVSATISKIRREQGTLGTDSVFSGSRLNVLFNTVNHLVYNKIWSALWKKGKPSMDCGSLSFWVWCESASVSWTQIAGMPPWFQRWPRHTGRCLHGFCSIVGMPPTGRNGWSHQLGFIIFIHHRFAGHHTRRCLLLLIGFPSFSMGSCQRYGLFMPVDVFVFSRFYTTNGNLPLRLARECSSCRLYHADYIYIIFL